MSGLFQDLRYAVRTFARASGFTAVVVLTLALGIGANTAIFSVVHSVLLKALPYRDPDRLVRIGHLRSEGGRPGETFSPQDFDDLARERPGLSRVAAYQFVPGLSGMNLLGKGEPVRVSACVVSADFFETLGVSAAAGRTLLPEENTPGRDRVAVVSERLRARLSGSGGVAVGSTLVLEGQPFTVAGVMPRTFQFPSSEVDLWVPVSLMTEDDVPHRRGIRWLEVVGRLAPGATREQARAGTTALFARLEREYPDSNRGFGKALVVPLETSILGEVRAPLSILLGAVCLVLLIACGNVANLLDRAVSETVSRPRFYASMLVIFAALALLLAGSGLYAVTSYGIAQRTREIGVRMALGADRRSVLLLVGTEALKSSGGGLALGLVLSAAAGRLLGSLLFGVRPFDPAVLAAVGLFLLGASLLAASVPALRAARLNPIEALRAA